MVKILICLFATPQFKMADRCYGCTSKYKFREKPLDCPQCRRSFCNKCLNRKKMTEPGYSCVYCSEKQKRVNKAEEKDILQNFQERYYKHKQQQHGSPKVSHVPTDERALHSTGTTSTTHTQKRGVLSPEDQELERRFLKLREDRLADVPTIDELQEKFDQFQGKDASETPKDSSSGPQNDTTTNTKTNFEQAQDLMQRMKEESELDDKLEARRREQDAEMAARFDALKDRETGVTPNTSGETPNDESEKVLSSTEAGQKPQTESDPEKLLQDLQKMASEEERAALKELGSSDLQSILKHVQPVDSNHPNITYPALEEVKSNAKEGIKYDAVSEEELQGLIKEGIAENKRDAELKARDEDFMMSASKKISELMDDNNESDEEEVKSKPRGKPETGQGLEFNWHHFESKGSAFESIGLDWFDEDDEDFDGQVQMLMRQISEENKLEERLEGSGLGHVLDEKKKGPEALANISSAKGATAAVPEEGDVLPWCCMCNADAAIKCFDCDNDLYCVPCFSQGHEDFQLFDHRYAPFEQSRIVH